MALTIAIGHARTRAKAAASRRWQVALIVVNLRLVKVGGAGICDISETSPVSSEVQ